ncbi:hypothetical protein C8J56DRAFT_902778 [Mycena floridula]|nr:hypothetical protein C8J56DRAFT_902778 [Mycena floridula]
MPVINIPALLRQLMQEQPDDNVQADWLGAASAGYIPAFWENCLYQYLLDKAFQYYLAFPLLTPAMDVGTDLDWEPDIHETVQWMQKFLFIFWGNQLAAQNISAYQCLQAITEFPLDTDHCPMTAQYHQHLDEGLVQVHHRQGQSVKQNDCVLTTVVANKINAPPAFLCLQTWSRLCQVLDVILSSPQQSAETHQKSLMRGSTGNFA